MCDTRQLPIVVIRWFGTIDLELVAAFNQMLDALLDMLEREQLRVAMVLDISGSDPPDSEVRRALISIRSVKLSRMRTLMAADFVVINRPALRAVITAMHWIAPQLQATPVASLDEALRRGQDALEREGIVAPRVTAIEFEGPGS